MEITKGKPVTAPGRLTLDYFLEAARGIKKTRDTGRAADLIIKIDEELVILNGAITQLEKKLEKKENEAQRLGLNQRMETRKKLEKIKGGLAKMIITPHTVLEESHIGSGELTKREKRLLGEVQKDSLESGRVPPVSTKPVDRFRRKDGTLKEERQD